MSIQQRHLISLMQTGFTTIQVEFDDPNIADIVQAPPTPWDGGAPVAPAWGQPVAQRAPKAAAKRSYTYKVRGKIERGDAVVVDTPRGLQIAYVLTVDPTPRIDTNATFDYKWIVQRVDTTAYDRQREDEILFAQTLQQVEVEKQRDELLKSFTERLPEGTNARALFNEALARLSGDPVAIAAPAPAQPAQACNEDGTLNDFGMQCK